MKISDFQLVDALVSTRVFLTAQREDGNISIKIGGRVAAEDAEMVEAVRPAVRAELDRRIMACEEQLRALGVDPDE